jgi:TIR domain
MQVFISWSGTRSRHIADAIRTWLPMVVQSVKPWMSDEDISAGARWLTEVSTTLNSTNVGIICITPENQHSPWLLFEAGALSKTLEQTCVCPLVFEMTPGQLTGPLTQFQANALDRDGIGKILATINKGLGDRRLESQQLEEILDVWWPKLAEKVAALPAVASSTVARSTNDQMEELLSLAREQLRRENLRLEASKEREDKLDSMLDFMERAGATLGSLQKQAQRVHPTTTHRLDSALANQVSPTEDAFAGAKDIAEAARVLLGSGAPAGLDASALLQMTNALRAMQTSDKQRVASMLTPLPSAKESE